MSMCFEDHSTLVGKEASQPGPTDTLAWDDFDYFFDTSVRLAFRKRIGDKKGLREYCDSEPTEPANAGEYDSCVAHFRQPAYIYHIPSFTVGDLRGVKAGQPLQPVPKAKAKASSRRSSDVTPAMTIFGKHLHIFE